MVERSPSPRPSPPGEGESDRRHWQIRTTPFFVRKAKSKEAKTASGQTILGARHSCSLSPGERVRVRASLKPFQFFRSRALLAMITDYSRKEGMDHVAIDICQPIIAAVVVIGEPR